MHDKKEMNGMMVEMKSICDMMGDVHQKMMAMMEETGWKSYESDKKETAESKMSKRAY